jgi:predicted RNase H-like HicB family nuclease
MKSTKYLIETRYGSFYATIAYSARDKVHFVSIPAFPGVLTEARSLTEAKKFAKEVIELQCLAALDDGKMVVDDTRQVHGRFVRAGVLAVA